MYLMNATPTLKKRPLLTGIALYQLIGGFIGLGLFLKLLPQLQNPSSSTWVGIAVAAILYFFSIVCGFLLLKGTRLAFNLSLANQILQIFSFGIAGVAYNYVAGVKIGVGIDFLESWLFKFRFSLSSFSFSFNAGTGLSFVSVNLLALVILYLLERLQDQRPQ